MLLAKENLKEINHGYSKPSTKKSQDEKVGHC